MFTILVGDDRAKDVRHWLHLSLLDYRPVHVDYMIIFLITDDSFIMYLLDKKGNGRAVFQQKKKNKNKTAQAVTEILSTALMVSVSAERTRRRAHIQSFAKRWIWNMYFGEKYTAMSCGWHERFKIKLLNLVVFAVCFQMTNDQFGFPETKQWIVSRSRRIVYISDLHIVNSLHTMEDRLEYW